MVHTLRLEIPYYIWRCEGSYREWLKDRGVTGFFWEVDRYGDFVTIEVID